MAQITKKVSARTVPTGRYQVFDQNEVNTGDIILVKDSLRGRAANHLTIDADANMTLKFNVIQEFYPIYTTHNYANWNESGERNLSAGIEYIASGEAADVTVSGGTQFVLDGDFSIYDIMVVATSGNFRILVS